MTQSNVVAALEEIAILLELRGENEFRYRAYSNAARTIAQLDADFAALVTSGQLSTVRGLGAALAEKVTTLVTTGQLPYLDDLRANTPRGLLAMLRVPGLGPKKARALHDALSIVDLTALEVACLDGQVTKVKGFGAKTAAKILDGVRFLTAGGDRVRFDKAYRIGAALLDYVSATPGVARAELAGSLRRCQETVKDIDIVVATADPESAVAAFVSLPEVTQITGRGPTKASVIVELHSGTGRIVIAGDLRAVTPEQYPFALVHFTGSKAHNIRLRQRAIERGLSLNEYELVGVDGPVPCADEAAVYAALGFAYIPPEMREDAGEIEAASVGPLPPLVKSSDIRGIFHNHSTWSDGAASIEEMATAARDLGYEYYGVADHSQSLSVANGLTPDRVRAQWAEVDALNRTMSDIRILKGTECDILGDGTLDFPDELLAGFDYVVASVHSLFGLSEAEQTSRVCRALSHPAVTMLGHATGRLLLRRAGYKIDLEQVIRAAADHGKMIEINAQPDRLDLDWVHSKRAKALGVPLVINPDGHTPPDLEKVPFGVNVARRAGLTVADVFNTLGPDEVVNELASRRKRR